MSVFSRLWIWREVSTKRDKGQVECLMSQVRATALTGKAILFAVDDFMAYQNAILKVFSDKYYSGKVGHPPRIPWPNLVQGNRGPHYDKERTHSSISHHLLFG